MLRRPAPRFLIKALPVASGVFLLATATVPTAEPAATPAASIETQFNTTVKPFVQQYCAPCHSGAQPAAGFDLASYNTVDQVVRDHPRWALVIDKLSTKQMPPAGMPAPSDAERQKVIGWITTMRADEARKHAGDPGPVLARRLSNSEYNYTIRDLTGQDIQPTREFPVDPADQAGFDNSGESLTMSPALLNKYMQAARDVANHAVLTPDSIDFAPTPMLVETDKDKYTIQRIISFYQSQPTDFADYFAAAWRYKYRVALGKPATETLAQVAASSKVSPKYLPLVYGILEESPEATKAEVGPIKKLQTMWHALPAPGATKTEPAREKFTAMRDWVVRLRLDTGMQYATPAVKGLPTASEALMDWKLEAYANGRRYSDPKALRNDEDPAPVVAPIPKYPGLHQDGAPHWAAVINKSRAADNDLIVPKAEHEKYQQAFERFANIFPDSFYVSERGRYFPDDSQDQGRLLSAGYHNAMGYYRDDTALRQLILNDAQTKQLNRLWTEFDFIADQTARTWVQFFFNQSGEVYGKGDEGGSPRPANYAVTDSQAIMKLKADYLAKAAEPVPTNSPLAPDAITEHFDRINNVLRNMEKLHTESEPYHVAALQKFAAKAYRRPLTKAESADIVAYYHELRDKNKLSHEDAVRDSIVAILMSPDFLYRIDLLPATQTSAGTKIVPAGLTNVPTTPSTTGVPLTAYQLASRLSYFIWSSMPDAELLSHAASGDLTQPAVLLAQTRRMLKDDRVKDFATEFGGNWLQFRRFETWNGVDKNRFPEFTPELREAMFQEPVRFIQDVVQHNRSIYDMLYGNYTYVNPVLAKFYGMDLPEFALLPPPPPPEPKAGGPGRGALPAEPPKPPEPKFVDPKVTQDTWLKVDDANKYQRGGILPMAVFMTVNSPGLRTSPVKRGHWMVTQVLGEVIPPPPPVVPELPSDEAKTDLPIRDLLAQHRSNPVCAACHTRFDVFGLTLESYGPVGETRTKDLAGRAVDPSATLPGNVQEAGFDGVKQYIKEHRQPGYIDGLTRKLLSYALDRSLILSDEPLVANMKTKLALNQDRFDSMIETVVMSSQFRNRRSDAVTQQKTAPTKTASNQTTEQKKGM